MDINMNGGVASQLLFSVISSVIAQNIVFARGFGITPMIAAAKNKRDLPGVCLGVWLFTTVSSIAMWLASGLEIVTSADRHYMIALYAVTVGLIYVLTLLLVLILAKNKFSRIKKYIHISAFNSAVMGTIFMSSVSCETLKEYVLFGLCAGAGFSAASYMLSGVYGQLYSENVPRAFRGYPAVMIFSGIMAMAVYGILGHAPSYM